MLDFDENMLPTNSLEWVHYGGTSGKQELNIRAWQKAALKQVEKRESLEVFFIKLARVIYGYDKLFVFVDLDNPLTAIRDFRSLLQNTGYTVYLKTGEGVIEDAPSYQDAPPVAGWEEKIVDFISQKIPINIFFQETLSLVCGTKRRVLIVNPKDPVEAVSRLNKGVLKDTSYYVQLTTLDTKQNFLKAV